MNQLLNGNVANNMPANEQIALGQFSFSQSMEFQS